ncbi:MAG: hypothetical protein LAO55_06355 [Acidobacteriia bacterium]|nr:hypothetical protein [Terriglobia bacterium]
MGDNSKYFTIVAVILGVMAAATLLAFNEDRHAGWQLRPSLDLNQVHFVVRHSNGFDNWVSGRDVPLDRFRGFSLSMLASPGPAKFEYVAEAGRLICEGRFLVGTGSGSYTFVADRAFVSTLQQMGYDTPDDDQLFSMLMMDIDRAFARGIRDAGLRASSRDLIGLKIHGVTLDFVREARQAGYQNFTADDYTQLRIHGVDTNFLRDLKDAGYDLRAGDIAQLRIHGVDSRYMRDLRSYGLKPEASDLSQMRIHGVTPDYLKGLKDAGYDNLHLDEINQLRIHGVEPRFVQEAKRLGYDFTPEELAQLRIHGVDAAYLKRIQDAGMRNLNAEQIAKLRIHGVD